PGMAPIERPAGGGGGRRAPHRAETERHAEMLSPIRQGRLVDPAAADLLLCRRPVPGAQASEGGTVPLAMATGYSSDRSGTWSGKATAARRESPEMCLSPSMTYD